MTVDCKNFTKRAEQIAKETSLEIIVSEIEDWKKSIKEYQESIDKFTKLRDNAIDKTNLWILANRLKKEANKK